MLKKIMSMLEGLNAMSLALGVIIGGAIGKVVGSLTSDVLMPLVSMVIPGGSWRNAELVLKRSDAGEVVNAIKLGTFLGTVIDFLIIAWVVQLLSKALVKPAPAPAPGPIMKTCSACAENVLAAANKCRYCGSAV
ncbi:MAG: MscL family protein [Candidatus Eisenbacteria bacterium]|nr:MscL family protein [Candidatus Eisenbacteria bacterium]